MDTAIRRLRSHAQQLARGKAPRAIRYPARFRTAAVKVARAHLDQGGALADLAHKLGVAIPTLNHWLERPASPRLRPVALEVTATRGKQDLPCLKCDRLRRAQHPGDRLHESCPGERGAPVGGET